MDLEERVKLLEERVQLLEKCSYRYYNPGFEPNAEIMKRYSNNTQNTINNSVIPDQNIQQLSGIQQNIPPSNIQQNLPPLGIYQKRPVKVVDTPPIYNVPNRKKSDLESFIGKNLFVVIASILIFLGVIVFAGTLLPYLSSIMKFILMCLITGAFTGFSFYYIKHKENNLSISLLACSLGTVYITLFTGHLYFKLIHISILFILLLAWLVTVYYCSKYQSLLFNIIGQIGIIISLVLCIVKAFFDINISFILYSTIFVFIAELVYDRLFKEGYIINSISMLLSSFILSFPVIIKAEKPIVTSGIDFPETRHITIIELFSKPSINTIAFILLIIMFSYIIIKNIIYTKSERISPIYYSIVNIGSIIVFGTFISNFNWYGNIAAILEFIYAGILFVITEYLFYSKRRHIILNILLIILSIIILFTYINIFDTPLISCIILMIPLLIYIYFTNTTFDMTTVKIICGIATVVNVAFTNLFSEGFLIKPSEMDLDINYIKAPTFYPVISITNIIYYITCVLGSIPIYHIITKNHRTLKKSTKVFLYLFIIGNILFTFLSLNERKYWWSDLAEFLHVNEWHVVINALIALFIQLLFWKGNLFDKTKSLFKQPVYICYFILNIIISFGLIINGIYDYDVEHFLLVYLIITVILITISVLNTRIILEKEHSLLSIYVGIKISFLITFIFHIMDFRPIVSIIMFIWAIACIIIGVKLSRKPLRVYALILSLLSAVKLVLIDISYDNSILRALSFIICGIMCFGISYIYHKIEKNTKLKE